MPPVVVPSIDVTGLPGQTRRELDNLVPTLTQMASWGQVRELAWAASDYFALTGTWTVSSNTFLSYRWTLVNTVMTLWISLSGTTTSAGMGAELYIRLPAGYGMVPTTQTLGVVRWDEGVGAVPGIVERSTGMIPHCLQLSRDTASTAWPTGTLDISVVATVPVYLL